MKYLIWNESQKYSLCRDLYNFDVIVEDFNTSSSS